MLNDLGYHATLKSVDIDSYRAALYGKPRQSQIAFSGWSTDYPAASGFIGALAGCTSPGNESGFCDPAIDARMARAERLQITDPAKARDEWASIEHDVMDQAPWVPLVSRSFANLVSQRLGNFQVSPQWGPLVDRCGAVIAVLYDEDCGFCRWSADKLRAWDTRRRLTFAAIQRRTWSGTARRRSGG